MDHVLLTESVPASVIGCQFASNPIDIEENTAGHLSAAECWPLDGSFPHLYLMPHRHPMKDAAQYKPEVAIFEAS